MRITSIEQKLNPISDGLAPINMQKLNRVVLLAGTNGSGKTRMLRRVIDAGHPNNEEKWRYGSHIEGPLIEPVPFVSNDVTLVDPGSLTRQQTLERAALAQKPGALHLSATAVAYIQQVQSMAWNASHQRSHEDEATRRTKTTSYELLCNLIETVLGAPLEMDADNTPTIFGKPIPTAGLSNGQTALIQWCAALHAQSKSLTNLVMTMDEPENHLHPKSMISTIDRIIAANENGQIWIATHSVPLIASLYNRHHAVLSLYFMSNGVAHFGGERPEEILKSLMGGEDNIEALREFVDLPEVLANVRFASQCLVAPEAIAAKSTNDPQVQVVSLDLIHEPTCTRVLDFGCGKGRVLDSLFSQHGNRLRELIDYVGWDLTAEYRIACECVIEKCFGTAVNRWFSDTKELFATYREGTFNRVLMCNVLHEINPRDWVECFTSSSVVNRSLAEDAQLLLIEDYLMPKGEYAHPFGFIVLDTNALRFLFGSLEESEEIRVINSTNPRIRGHLISAHLLMNVTEKTVREALVCTQQAAKAEIVKLRAEGTHDFKSGRAHGFWVQQYANTTLALEELWNFPKRER